MRPGRWRPQNWIKRSTNKKKQELDQKLTNKQSRRGKKQARTINR